MKPQMTQICADFYERNPMQRNGWQQFSRKADKHFYLRSSAQSAVKNINHKS
jgi:hypothetical protein